MSCVRRSLPNDEMSREGCQTDQIRCDQKLSNQFAERDVHESLFV